MRGWLKKTKSRNSRSVTKPAKNVEFVDRPTVWSKLPTVSPGPCSPIHLDTLEMLRENHLCSAPRCGTTVAL